MTVNMPPPGQKRCTRCGQFKSDGSVPGTQAEFYEGRAQCKECYKDLVESRRASRRPGVRVHSERPPRPLPVIDDVVHHDGPGTIGSRWPNLDAFDLDDLKVMAGKRPEPAREPKIELVEEKITQVEEHRLKRRVADLNAQIKTLTADLSDARRMGEFVAEVEALPPVEGIKPREQRSGLAEATPLVLASDWHIEEEVRPEQVDHRNRYNLEISRRRMERFFEATRWGINHNRQVFKIRDLCLWLGGDLITNYLHEDNVENNLLSPVEAIAYAQASLGDGIRFLLEDEELERIVLPCNDGNHGRLTKKTRSATRIENSIEWLLYTMLAREFKDEPRIEFLLPTSPHTYYEIYGRTIRFTHGDTCKYGGGVGGITIPIYKALARWQTVRQADLTCMGHFHQRTSLSDLIINGSLIGYSPYSLDIGARFEPPAQEFSILEPRRFRGLSMPLWVSEREDDQR